MIPICILELYDSDIGSNTFKCERDKPKSELTVSLGTKAW